MIDADRDRLRELINNLIDNAIRYSQAGGRVTVRGDRPSGGEQCRLSISDDGPSIPVEERARIFERFHRLLGTPAGRQRPGPGHRQRDRHPARRPHHAGGGRSDGIGNTFSVFFPASRTGH